MSPSPGSDGVIEVIEKNPEKGSQNIQGTGEAVLQEQAKKAGTTIWRGEAL